MLPCSVATLFVLSAPASALDMAPPPFIIPGTSDLAIFVDWQSAEYDLVYRVGERAVSVHASISFYADKQGMPVFDFVPEIKCLRLDGQVVSATFETSLGEYHAAQALSRRGYAAFNF